MKVSTLAALPIGTLGLVVAAGCAGTGNPNPHADVAPLYKNNKPVLVEKKTAPSQEDMAAKESLRRAEIVAAVKAAATEAALNAQNNQKTTIVEKQVPKYKKVVNSAYEKCKDCGASKYKWVKDGTKTVEEKVPAAKVDVVVNVPAEATMASAPVAIEAAKPEMEEVNVAWVLKGQGATEPNVVGVYKRAVPDSKLGDPNATETTPVSGSSDLEAVGGLLRGIGEVGLAGGVIGMALNPPTTHNTNTSSSNSESCSKSVSLPNRPGHGGHGHNGDNCDY